MADVTRATYMKLDKRAGKNWRDRLEDAWIKAQREVFSAYADEIANGYRSIVENWSPESKPSFAGRAEFQKRTGRWFVRVQIIGDEVQRKRFEGLDFGAKRGQKVASPDVAADPKALAARLKGKGIQVHLSIPPGVSFTGKITGYNEKTKAPIIDTSAEAHAEWLAEQRKKYERLYSKPKGRFLSPAEATRERMREMYPALRYRSKTGKGAVVGRAGKIEQPPVGWMYEYELGPIQERAWTIGLNVLVKNGKNVAGVRKLWPNLRTWEQTIRSAYATAKYRTST